MTNLIGIHDRQAASFSPPGTWVVDTIALSENPTPPQYDANHTWLVRANWGYGSTGTIPLNPDDQNIFISRLVSYIKVSVGCSRWIIGNEPNLSREWPNGKPIDPWRYADFFRRCRSAVRDALGTGTVNYKFFIAASGPWNNELKYIGNSDGDWVKNFSDTIAACQGEFDGFSIHSYTHSYDTRLVTSETKMDAPFQTRHYDFQTYKDYLSVIPGEFSNLEVHLTEANGGKNWQAVGLMPAMAAEIDRHNRSVEVRKIKSLIFFRYPSFDVEYHMQGIAAVEKEYLDTVARNFQSPLVTGGSKITIPPQPAKPSSPPQVPENLISGKPTAKVTALLLNVRDKPGITISKIIGSKKLDDKISVLEEKGVAGELWYRIGPDQWINALWTDRPPQSDGITLSDWDKAKKFTSGWEGGFQNFNWDPGNWTGCKVGQGTLVGTNFGISACAHPNLDIKNLTREQADKIYFEEYWLATGCDKLPWPLNLIVFDTAINFGVTNAKNYLAESGGNLLHYIALRLRGYRHSDAWLQAHDAWIDRTIDLLLEATG